MQTELDRLGWCRLHPLVRQFLQKQEAIDVETAGEDPLRSAFVSGMIAISSQMPDNPTTKDIEWFGVVQFHIQEIAKQHTAGLEGNDLLGSFVGLARFYQGQALFKDAESQYAECLTLMQRLFEGDHSSVATNLNNLALLYNSQGRWSEAEPLLRQTLEMFERTLGITHPNTQVVRENLEITRQPM